MATLPTLGPNAVTTDSGLSYEDQDVGTGRAAQAGDLVSVHYRGFLQDGTMFDSSHQRQQPFQFALGERQVIRGWDEGVEGMQVGGHRTLVIPGDLGYGERGAGNVIPPNATLIFEVELLEVRDRPRVPTAPADVESYESRPSGLQVAVLEPGSGREAGKGDTVTVHYTGWLENGARFDSSIARGEPIEFVLGQRQVIPGWDEGLQGMQVGEKRQLRIPSRLAYGDRGAGNVIPPNATLIFDVELLDAQ